MCDDHVPTRSSQIECDDPQGCDDPLREKGHHTFIDLAQRGPRHWVVTPLAKQEVYAPHVSASKHSKAAVFAQPQFHQSKIEDYKVVEHRILKPLTPKLANKANEFLFLEATNSDVPELSPKREPA